MTDFEGLWAGHRADVGFSGESEFTSRAQRMAMNRPSRLMLQDASSSWKGSDRIDASRHGRRVEPPAERPQSKRAPINFAFAAKVSTPPIVSDSACWGDGKNGLRAAI